MSSTIKIDMHIHSEESPDGITSVERIVDNARDCGLDGISITDHDYYDSERQRHLRETTDLIVVPGQEVTTNQGHVLAYFIDEEIESFRDASDVVEDIHDQNGLAVMAHPFRLRENYPDHYFELFDAIEVFNGRSGDPDDSTSPNYYTRQVVEHNDITAVTGGSDSHVPWTVGNGVTELTAKSDLSAIREAILNGGAKAYGDPSYNFNRAISKAVYLSNNPSMKDWMEYCSDAARWIGRDCRSVLGF